MALLNAVERSVNLPSRLTVVNYFSIMTVMHILTLSKKVRSLVSTPCNLSTPTSSVAKQRLCIWWTISLLINATNTGNK